MLTLHSSREIEVSDAADGGPLLPVTVLHFDLFRRATPTPSSFGVAPHVGSAMGGRNIQESDTLQSWPFTQIQRNAIALWWGWKKRK